MKNQPPHQLLVVTAGFLALTLAFAGCSSSKKSNNPPSRNGVGANIFVNGESDGTTDVSIQPFVAQGTVRNPFELADGDSATATYAGQTITLQRGTSTEGDVEYSGTFQTNDDNARFDVALRAPSMDFTATNSSATLPVAANFQLPAENQEFGPGDTVSITWLPSGSNFQTTLRAETNCSDNQPAGIFERENIPDNGSFSVNANTLADNPSTGNNPVCTITLLIGKREQGTLDGAFVGGGSIYGAQIRQRTIRVNY